MLYSYFSFVVVLLLIRECVTNKHLIGVPGNYSTFYTNEVLNINQTDPKNYTILFEYLGSKDSPPIDVCKIDINVHARVHFELFDRLNRIIKAAIYIPTATNVTATIRMGTSGDYDSYAEPSNSLVMVFSRSATSTVKTKPYYQNSLGHRQLGDKLLYFKSKNVTNANKFSLFEYIGGRDTRITYVGFSFNSPTAVALINSTFALDRSFSAITYDVNTDHFMANVSIYGFENRYQPTYQETIDIMEEREVCYKCTIAKMLREIEEREIRDSIGLFTTQRNNMFPPFG